MTDALKPKQNHFQSLRVTFDLGELGYDRQRMGSGRDRLATLVNEAHAEGMTIPEIAALVRVTRQNVRDLLEEAV